MMYQELKKRVFDANIAIHSSGLVLFTWGNVSARDNERKIIAIKPSGVPYATMKSDDIVIVDYDGKIIDGALNPSVDLLTHLELYLHYPEIQSIVHTHSTYATVWAQKGRAIPIYGTTHADYFCDEIPCADYPNLIEAESYEKGTGLSICNVIKSGHVLQLPATIVKGHGAFSWGSSPEEAVHNAIVLEQVAKMAYLTETLPGENRPLPKQIRDVHFQRKHGPKSTYGQKT